MDRYDRNKLVFSAFQNIQIVEEINDDFDDMDEDIESYRYSKELRMALNYVVLFRCRCA